MRRALTLLALILLPVPAADAAVCGPEGARTLARTPVARVYAEHGRVAGCHRTGRTTRLGRRRHVLGVYMAGRAAALRLRGEGLVVYDLRRGRATERAELDGRRPVRRLIRVVVDPVGAAAFVARLSGSEPRFAVGSTGEFPGWTEVDDLDPSVLGFASGTVLYSADGSYHLFGRCAGGTRGTLLRLPGVRIDGFLRASGRAVDGRMSLGERSSGCPSSFGYEGVSTFQVRAPFVATWFQVSSRGYVHGSITVHNLATRERRTLCAVEDGQPGPFVLTESGGVACAPWTHAGERWIESEGVVLDRGPGIDTGSFRRAGERLVWRHDGIERSAPLPAPPSPE